MGPKPASGQNVPKPHPSRPIRVPLSSGLRLAERRNEHGGTPSEKLTWRSLKVSFPTYPGTQRPAGARVILSKTCLPHGDENESFGVWFVDIFVGFLCL